MYYPYVWNARNTPSLEESPNKFKFINPPIPEEHCDEDAPANPKGCKLGGLGIAEYYTNNTVIPGEATLPMEMYDKWSLKRRKNKPWSAPGTAPILGEGCGVNGGNPDGCNYGMSTFFKTVTPLEVTKLIFLCLSLR